MQVQLFVGNHAQRYAIQDHVRLIQEVFAKRGVTVDIVEELREPKPTLIIDEFTNIAVNREIRAFKADYPQVPFIVLLTEFVEKKWGVVSFNLFGGFFQIAALVCLDVIVRSRRPDFEKVSLRSWFKALLYSPFAAFYFFKHRRATAAVIGASEVTGDIKKSAYMHIRFLGLQSMLDCLDGVFLMHEDISLMHMEHAKSKKSLLNLGVIYPEFDIESVLPKIWDNKRLGFEITGSMTDHRRQRMKKLHLDILGAGMNRDFAEIQDQSFSSETKSDGQRSCFSFHPPQTGGWMRSSPTRLYRAISEDGNLPVVTRHFQQNPIEDLAIVYEGMETLVLLRQMYKDRDKTKEMLEQRMKAYNERVRVSNDQLISGLKMLKVSE
jgi:hypothetical protein